MRRFFALLISVPLVIVVCLFLLLLVCVLPVYFFFGFLPVLHPYLFLWLYAEGFGVALLFTHLLWFGFYFLPGFLLSVVDTFGPFCVLLLVTSCWSLKAMAQVILVANLKKTSQRPMLLVRVAKVWPTAYLGAANPFSMNFVLLDDKGGAIQGLVPIDVHGNISKHFAEGRLCEISRFSVVSPPIKFHTVCHAFSLQFVAGTSVRPLDEGSLQILLHILRPIELEEVGTTIAQTYHVADFIARIVGFTDI